MSSTELAWEKSKYTRYHNEEQIINAFESLGAQFSNYSLKDMSIVSCA
jgi:zinc protease